MMGKILSQTTVSGHEMRRSKDLTLKEPCVKCGKDVNSYSSLTTVCADCAY